MNPDILPLPARPFVYRMLSRSMPGKVWTVWTAPGGRAACTCPGGWAWGMVCYHMTEVLELETALALRAEDQQALAPIPVVRPRAILPAPVELQAMMIIAKNVPAAAGVAVPKKLDAGQAFAVMLAGWEFGIGPMTALRHIIVVNGRTEPDAQLMMGLCRALEPDIRFDWQEVSPTRAALALWRHGELVITVEFTEADAEAAGRLKRPTRPVWGNGPNGREVVGQEEYDGPWQTHTALMLAYNAAKMACKLGASDLINAVQGAAGYALEATAAALDEGQGYEPELIGSVDDEPDFLPPSPSSGNRSRGGGWSDSPPPRGKQQPRKPGPPPPAEEDIRPAISAALGKHKVTGAQLAALVGGGSVSAVKAYMAREGLDLDGVMLRAKADRETGELPETVEGEVRELGEEE